MSQFLNQFFFYDQIPQFLRTLGENFGFDTACLCSFPNFFNLIIHFIIAAVIFGAIAKGSIQNRKFLTILLVGVLFSGVSKLVDWSQNILTATGDTVFWNNNLDLITESLQFIGIGLILWSLLTGLRQMHESRTTTIRPTN